MPQLWLPEQAQAAIHEDVGRQEAARVEDFTARLRGLDERLHCWLQLRDAWILGDPPPGYEPKGPPIFRAGFYYVLRRNDDGTVATWEISNPDGSFKEPDESVIEAFRRADSHSRDVWNEEIVEARRRAERQVEAERQKAKEDRLCRADDLLAFETRVQVPAGQDGLGMKAPRRR